MRFLIDQDVYQLTIEFIKDLGHEVIPVKDVGLSTAADEKILAYALKHNLILVTRDNDYGALKTKEYNLLLSSVILACPESLTQ